MDLPTQKLGKRLEAEPASKSPQPVQPQRKFNFRNLGRRILSRSVLIPGMTFVSGLIFGVLLIIAYALSISANGQVLPNPSPPASSDLTAQAGRAYITHLVEKNIRTSGMAEATNIQVTLARGDQMTIEGDDQVVLGVTRHFTLLVQPVILSCELKIHVVHADLGGVPITGFVTNFEGQINQQIQSQSTTLPAGFVYCKTSVRTDPQFMYVTLSAKPV